MSPNLSNSLAHSPHHVLISSNGQLYQVCTCLTWTTPHSANGRTLAKSWWNALDWKTSSGLRPCWSNAPSGEATLYTTAEMEGSLVNWRKAPALKPYKMQWTMQRQLTKSQGKLKWWETGGIPVVTLLTLQLTSWQSWMNYVSCSTAHWNRHTKEREEVVSPHAIDRTTPTETKPVAHVTTTETITATVIPGKELTIPNTCLWTKTQHWVWVQC